MLAGRDKVSREAAGRNKSCDADRLRRTELGVAATVSELAPSGRVDRRTNCCLTGGSRTRKTHRVTGLGRLGKKVRLVTAAGLVTALGEAHHQHRTLAGLDRRTHQCDPWR